MKTLKKVLSLVLVVAMIASMLIVGAAAAEEETTLYEEAVAVVTGVGIIEGDGNGYNFQKTVSREEAAKIIAYLLLGEETAKALKTTTAPFADVAANRWSAGYIAYLKGQGIISGVSDTEFDPLGKVTGIAFAKMLLTAVGYGKAGEFEGKDWDINTITFANDNGVFTDTLAADLAAGATREEAMLYAFNVLTGVPVVKYNKTFESYYVGPSALNPVTGTVNPAQPEILDDGGEVVGYTPYAYTLGYTKYALVKDTGLGTTDDFGRPAASWTSAGAVIADTVSVADPDYTVYGELNSDVLYTTLGKAVADNLNTNLVGGKLNITVYVDGTDNASTPFAAQLKAGHTGTNKLFGAGAVTELYLGYTAGKWSVTAVTHFEYIGEVKSVKASANQIVVDQLAGGDDLTVSGEDFDITGYAKEDMVLYTVANDEITSIAPLDYTIGTYSATGAMGFGHMIDNVSVPVSIKAVNYFAGTTSCTDIDTVGDSYKLWKDTQGNILMAELHEEAELNNGAYNYLYVVSTAVQAYDDSVYNAKDAGLALTVVYPEGGKEIVYYNVKYSKTLGYYVTYERENYSIVDVEGTAMLNDGENNLTVAAVFDDGWYSYTTNEAGKVTLKALNDNYAAEPESLTAMNLVANIASTGLGYRADGKTVLSIVDADGFVTSYTGVANFPEVAITDGDYDDAEVLVTYAKDNKKLAKTITIFTTEDAPVDPTYAYVVMDLGTSTAGTTIMAYIDGVMQFVTVSEEVFDAMAGSAMWSVCTYAIVEGEPVFTPVTPNYTREGDGLYNWFQCALETKTNTWLWGESATIDIVDDNYFSTVAIEDEDEWDDSVEKMIQSGIPGGSGITEYEAAVEAGITAAREYYYDADTIIYDCVNGGIVTELNSGDVFYAMVDASTDAYGTENYCEYIWIIG